jgi:hypothetical protein
MQAALDRAEMEAASGNTAQKLECLQQLPGFKMRSEKELLRMLLDHSVTVKQALPHQVLVHAGACMTQVHAPSLAHRPASSAPAPHATASELQLAWRRCTYHMHTCPGSSAHACTGSCSGECASIILRRRSLED